MVTCELILIYPAIPQKPRVTADRVLPQLRLDEETEEEGEGERGGRFVSPPGSPTLELKVPLQPANLLRSVGVHFWPQFSQYNISYLL